MFSIVITTKDRIDYLERCIQSIVNSSVQPEEILIVNDGGKTIDSAFIFSQENVKIINNSTSMGANYSRNLGIRKAANEIVFLIDDDDSLTPQSLESRLNVMLPDSKVGLCFTGVQVVSSKHLSKVLRVVMPFESNDYAGTLLRSGNVIGSTSRVAVRKTYFNIAGGFDEKLNCFQDYDLWIRMSEICKITSDNGAGVFYTIHEAGGQISANPAKYERAREYLLNKYKIKLKQSNTEDKFNSNLLLRISLSYSRNSFYQYKKYAWLAFNKKPSIKAFVLLFFPISLLRLFREFA